MPRLLVLFVLCAALGACHHTKKEDLNATATTIYSRAHKQILDGTFEQAAKSYESLEARYPFSNEARQGRLDIMYAYYRAHLKEQAIDAADTFIRENPTHSRVDYAYYIKGLVYFERSPNMFEKMFSVDMSQRPPADARKSFEAFFRLVQLFPQSEYAPDARQRMIYLRNRLAEYEIHVARYYVARLRRRAQPLQERARDVRRLAVGARCPRAERRGLPQDRHGRSRGTDGQDHRRELLGQRRGSH